jgi:hypothetical protein
MFSKQTDEQQANYSAAYMCPTSPWTEPFQAASSHRHQPETAAFDSDDQKPTHDALSDIYNRGYE